MRILFVGDLNEYSRTRQRLSAMEKLGHDVDSITTVPIGQVPGLSGRRKLVPRIANKLGRPLDLTGANRKVMEYAWQVRPDIVWIEKGLTIKPRTLLELRRRSPATAIVSYSEDDMMRKGNRSQYYEKAIPHYSIIFTTKSYNANEDELPALGGRNIIFVDKAYCEDTHTPKDLSKDDIQQFGADIGFIGTFEKERAQLIQHLAKRGFSVRVFGNGWGRFSAANKNVHVAGRPIYGEDYAKAICATKVNLCFLRKVNRDRQTDRTMEIPACGGFMLAERTDEHQRLFAEDKEAVYFDPAEPEELESKVRHYLENEADRVAVAAAGRERCVSSGYSHRWRVASMLDRIRR